MNDLVSKRIMVTGGAGFLGTHIMEELRQLGCQRVFAPLHEQYDLRRSAHIDVLFETHRPAIVIHAAAVVGGIAANRANPGSFFYDNAIMGIQLIEACRRYAVEKVVVLGTVCAYPKLTPVPFNEDDLWSGYPEETNAPYGLAKKMLLVQCQAYRRQFGLNCIYLLPVNLYGPGDHFHPEWSHVIPGLIRKCVDAVEQGKAEIAGWGDGSATREFLFVRDAAAGIVSATASYDRAEPVNLGTGQEISIAELAAMIAEITSFRGRVVWDTSRPNGQPRRRLDTRRAWSAFGFRATTPLEDGLRQTIAWYRSHREAAEHAHIECEA